MTTSIRTSFDPHGPMALFDIPFWASAVDTSSESVSGLEDWRNLSSGRDESKEKQWIETHWTVVRDWQPPSVRDASRSSQTIEAVFLAIVDSVAEDAKALSIPSSLGIIQLDRKLNLIKSLYFNTLSSGIGTLVDRIAEAYSSELNEALRDLREARDEAREEGLPQPSDIALENAERLLTEMYGISPRRFEVYPTPDGEIAIDAPDGQGRSVILLCDSEGGALCLVNMNGNHRRARYSTTETLPDGFVHEALQDLELYSNLSL